MGISVSNNTKLQPKVVAVCFCVSYNVPRTLKTGHPSHMGQIDKLIKRLLSNPKDFTWAELKKLLNALGYRETNAGKTSGSRVRFLHEEHAPIILHKPHPKPTLKGYQIRLIIEALKLREQI